MIEKVARLACARWDEDKHREHVAHIEAELALTYLGQKLATAKERLARARTYRASVEEDVRNVALELYRASADKQPHPAIKIIQQTVLDYEEQVALDYSREHLPKALKLDKRVFEKAAKVLELDFVEIRQEPATRIDSDLSAYLLNDLQREKGDQ